MEINNEGTKFITKKGDDDKIRPYEPKKNNRFLLRLPPELKIQEWTIKKTNKPTYVYDEEKDISYWEDIYIELRNPIEPSPTQGIYKMLEMDSFIYELEDLDPTGVVVEKWVIEVDKVKKVDFGGILEYGDGEIQIIKLILKIKNAIPIFC